MHRCQAGSLGPDLSSDEGCPRQVLWWRHQSEEEVAAEAGQGQEAHEVHGQSERAAGGLHGGHPDQRLTVCLSVYLSVCLSQWMAGGDSEWDGGWV